MKKILPILLVLGLAAAGAAVYLVQKPRLDARAASVTSGYLPAQTLLLLSLPDPAKAAQDWKTTDLYKIWTEPQVQAFFAKPLSKVPSNQEASDTWAQVQHLNPKNLFVALTALDEKNNQPHLVAGFQFDGTTADVNKLLAKPKDSLRQKYPAGKADLQQYQGHSLETFDTGDGTTAVSTFAGKWYLIGNDVALLKSTLDHLDGHAPAGDKALEQDADFQAVSAKLPSDHASLVFARPKVFLSKIYDLTAATGQTVDPAQRAEAEKIKAVGATTAIEKGKLRDTFYALMPGRKTAETKLALSGLPLSSADTLIYLAGVMNLPENYHVPTASPGSPGASVYEAFGQFMKNLESKGVTLEKFRTAFGREITFQVDWPAANGSQPTLIASVDLRDRAEAAKFADNLSASLADSGTWTTENKDGLALHEFSMESISKFVVPTYTLTDKHFVFGPSAASVGTAAAREKTGGQNFTATQAYKDSVPTVPKATDAFGFVDAKGLFERTYNALKPMAALSSMMYPQASDYVEVGKLPDVEAIAKHLSPIVYSTTADEQGMTVESVGPVTFLQAEVGLGGIAGAAAVPILQKQFGAFGLKPGPAGAPPGEDAADAPDVKADETPESTPASTP